LVAALLRVATVTAGLAESNGSRVCGGFCGALQSFESLEKHLLDGQKLQGPPTAADVYRYLELRAADDGYSPTYRPTTPL